MAKQDLDQALALIRSLAAAAELTAKQLESAAPAVAPAVAPEPPAEPQRQVVYSGLNVAGADELLFDAKLISTIKALRSAAGSRAPQELREAADYCLRLIVERNARGRSRLAA
ncbi:MAG: hypothetical protein ACOYLQ_09680 [Hyphomicrobiaceae bacterium]